MPLSLNFNALLESVTAGAKITARLSIMDLSLSMWLLRSGESIRVEYSRAGCNKL
jgi:hypothetical protein